MSPKKTLPASSHSGNFLKALAAVLLLFFISSLPIFLSYILKQTNPSDYGLLKGAKNDLEITYKEILFFFSLVLASCVLSFSYQFIRSNFLKRTLIVLALIYWSIAALMILTDLIYYIIFAYPITFSAVQTVLNTNPEEVSGFIKLYCSTGPVFILALFIFVIFLIIRKRRYLISFLSNPAFFYLTAVLSVVGVIDFIQLAHSKGNGTHNMRYWDIIIGEYNEYNEFNRRLMAEKNRQGISENYNTFYTKDTLNKTLVLVISESLSKGHMSLYGYPRATTPHLDTMSGMYKFNDVVTSAALTIDAVPGLFFNGYWDNRINLITLLKKQNYKTYWISNQSGWGKGDRGIVLLSQLCDTSVFMDKKADDSKSNSSLHYDEDVLDDFKRTLGSSSKASKFIVVHLMGCHYDYEKRYPSRWNTFHSVSPAKVAVSNKKAMENLNSYDNAMLYHDSVLNKLVEIFRSETVNENAAFVFLSDHGEELYENRDHAGHGFPPSKVTSEIPYFTLLSPDFKSNFPDVEKRMKNRSNTPYSTSNNFFTVLQLLNIHSKKYQGSLMRNSFFGPGYDSTQTRLVMNIDYKSLEK